MVHGGVNTRRAMDVAVYSLSKWATTPPDSRLAKHGGHDQIWWILCIKNVLHLEFHNVVIKPARKKKKEKISLSFGFFFFFFGHIYPFKYPYVRIGNL